MRLSLKAKQVAGVTALVALVVVLMSGWYLSLVARVRLEESQSRAEMIADAMYQRSFELVQSSPDPMAALEDDEGLRTILQAAQAYSADITYAAIVDPSGTIIAHGDASQIGGRLPPVGDLTALVKSGPIAQARAIYTPGGRTYEFHEPLLATDPTTKATQDIGSIHVAVSTLLIRDEFEQNLRTPILTVIGAIVGATVLAMLLAQLVLRPIHVIRTGLARLGRGELDVAVDLPPGGELGDLGDSFKAVTARLAADRSQLAGQQATLASVVERLEDAVALVGPDGTVLFANPAMRAALGAATVITALPSDHPYRTLVSATLADGHPRGPQSVPISGDGDRLVATNVVEGPEHRPLGVLLVGRNVAYLSQVESTLRYSRKLAALGRLSAGIAHEIKNPLNAMMIHLELLRQQLAELPESLEHVSVIASQTRRLDEVVQGFLKFTRPEDLRLQAMSVTDLLDAILPIVRAESDKHGIDVRLELPPDLPPVSVDPTLIEQALLNLALNACQAMPQGGKLRLAASVRPRRRVEILIEDSGIGIPPEHLGRIFDLYFTTKEHGSGIGLSMVYRAVQLHDGEIEVRSSPGRGTAFRVTLQQAETALAPAPETIPSNRSIPAS